MAEKKNYVGYGWKRAFDDGGEVINLELKKEILDTFPVDRYGNIKIVVSKLKVPNEKSKASHTAFENTYIRAGGNEGSNDAGF